MFDQAIHRRKDPAVDVPADRSFQMLAETVHDAAVNKDVRSEEILTAAIWALMRLIHQHGVQNSSGHLGPRFIRAVGGNARAEQSLTAAHRMAESRTRQPSPERHALPQPLPPQTLSRLFSAERRIMQVLDLKITINYL